MKSGWTEDRGPVSPINNPLYPPTGVYCIKCRLRQYAVNSLCGNCARNAAIANRRLPGDSRPNKSTIAR